MSKDSAQNLRDHQPELLQSLVCAELHGLNSVQRTTITRINFLKVKASISHAAA
jgi:hypothetical protein